MVLQRNQILLFAGLVFAIAAGMVMGLTTGLLKGPEVAHAQIAQVTGDKSDTGDGTYTPGEQFDFILTFNVASQTSQIVQYNDLLPPEIEFASVGPAIDTLTPGLNCTAGLSLVICSLPIGSLPGFYSVNVNVQIASTAACGPVTNILRTGPIEGQGTFSADETIDVINCAPPVQPLFRLCKEWELQGPVAAPRDFRFDVTDSSSTVEVVIPNVVEGGEEECILVSAAPGPISVEEIGVNGFDEPDWYFENTYQDTDHTANFSLFPGFCATGLERLVLIERLVEVVTFGQPSCEITFVNEDNDQPTVTVTTTPTIVVCVLCNRTTTPPPATSTPTTPATATSTPPPSTQPPSTQPPATATATPTTSMGSQQPGLTDAQRTQTAVAAARTAAAQSTPIAPRTGGGAMGGAGGTLNIALLAAGLLVLSSGLSLVAVRGKRR